MKPGYNTMGLDSDRQSMASQKTREIIPEMYGGMQVQTERLDESRGFDSVLGKQKRVDT